MENLGVTTASKITRELKVGTEKTLIDADLINHLKEEINVEKPSFFNKKLIMIEDDNQYHLVSTKLSEGTSCHCIIALTYMLEHKKYDIKIFGGGRIKFIDGKFKIYGKSGSFGQMDKRKVSDIMRTLNEHFEVDDARPDTVRERGRMYSYDDITEEIHDVLSD